MGTIYFGNNTSLGVAAMAGFLKVRMPFSAPPQHADVREAPLYSLSEVAVFLGIPRTTLAEWVKPHTYKRQGYLEPLILPAGMSTDMATGKDVAWLSFYNLNEAHILSTLTRFHGVKLFRVRHGIDSLKQLNLSNPAHPLLSKALYTDGRDLFLKAIERRKKLTINLSQGGQLGFNEVLDLYLERIVRDENDNPIKLYPQKQSGKIVSIAPKISSGRPIVDAVGIPVASLWNRYRAGDSPEFLAEDYGISQDQVRGAIDFCEQRAA